MPAEASVVDAEPPGLGGARAARRSQRLPKTLAALARLKTQLGNIRRAPCSIEQAREAIDRALCRAGLAAWQLPPPGRAPCRTCGDGSVVIGLISHQVIINPWGAFRIVDCHSPDRPYHEQPGCGMRPFVNPPERER